MDRLQKIKGYSDRLPADDARWLVAEVETARAERDRAIKALVRAEEQRGQAANELARLLAKTAPDRCPCLHPKDHAGWCPRR